MASRNIDDLNPHMRCNKCGEDKPTPEFSLKRGKPTPQCKKCTAEYAKAWHQENKERRNLRARELGKINAEQNRARQRKWVSENRATANAYSAKYRLNNLEKARASVDRWAEQNKDHKLACYSAWASRNKEKVLRRNRERQHAKIRAIPSWFGEFDTFVFEEALLLSDLRMAATGVEHNVDHMVPLKSKYVCGLHCASNFAVIPALENKAKGNRYWPDMGEHNGL